MGRYARLAITLGIAATLAACDDSPIDIDHTNVRLANHSATPALVKGLPPGVRAYSLLGSDDDLVASPGYVFGGSAGGAGLLANADGTFTILVNHENNFAVSRITLDETFKPARGEYVLNSDAGRWRLGSATMATREEHGFGPTFLTVGESSVESMIHALNPMGTPNTSRTLPALGRWQSENAVPLPKEAHAHRTVILMGDDDSGANGGQLVLYVGTAIGDLDKGSLYVLTRDDDSIRERDMVVGQSYPITFRQIPDQVSKAGAQLDAEAAGLNAVRFGRTGDIDYRKVQGDGREIYFTTKGQASSGVNADDSRTKYGRVYRLVTNPGDPTKGTLEVILDGDDRDGPVGQLQNPDDIMATENYLYFTEDPNGYGDETHDARMYQYDIRTGRVAVVMELDHRRFDARYNVGGSSPLGSWQFGVTLDISDEVGIDGAFLVAIQPHSWRGDRYRGVDGGSLRTTENRGSQLLVVEGLPR